MFEPQAFVNQPKRFGVEGQKWRKTSEKGTKRGCKTRCGVAGKSKAKEKVEDRGGESKEAKGWESIVGQGETDSGRDAMKVEQRK